MSLSLLSVRYGRVNSIYLTRNFILMLMATHPLNSTHMHTYCLSHKYAHIYTYIRTHTHIYTYICITILVQVGLRSPRFV